MVLDGDVINRDDLRTALSAWLVESTIKLAETLFVVDKSLIFDTTLTPDPRTKLVDLSIADSFIDSIPFQRMTIIKRPMKSGVVKVIATNKDLVSVIEHAFEKEGYEVLGMFPDLNVVSENINNAQFEDVVEKAKRHLLIYTVKNAQQLAFSLTPLQKKPLTQMSVSEAVQQPVQPGVAVAIVLILVVCAIGVGYWQYYEARQQQISISRKRIQLAMEKKKNTDATSTTPIHVAAKQPTPSAPTSKPLSSPPSSKDSSPSVEIRATNIQILYTSQTEKLYESIKTAMTKTNEYKVMGQMETRELTENRIFVAAYLDPDTVGKIVDTIRSAGVTATQKQATIEGYDVVVELGLYAPTAPTLPLGQITP